MVFVMLLAMIFAMAAPVYAEDGSGLSDTAIKAIAAAAAIGLAAVAGAISMGLVTSKSAETIARQPEAESKIRTSSMLGLVFIETVVIYALITVILIIFVL